MKALIKVIISLVLLLILFVACGILLFGLMSAGWMHTYQAFTSKTLVAEVTISALQEDEMGEYADVSLRPFQQTSALNYLIDPDASPRPEVQPVQQFKVYGDTVHLGGPIVKFYDHLIFLNFETIYKLATLYGRYSLDFEQENNRKSMSNFELNGGIDETWRSVNENITEWPYELFFDLTQISAPGKLVPQREERTYNFYITNTGFTWEETEN